MLELFFQYELFAFVMALLLGLCDLEDDSYGHKSNVIQAIFTGFFLLTFVPTLIFATYAIIIYVKAKNK